jgi:DNA-binding LytR/AlgR family response regulator
MNLLPTSPITPPDDTPGTITLLRGSVTIGYDDIVRLEGESNYTRFVLTNDRTLLTSRNIGFYESLLPENFLRVHKRCILNQRFVTKKYKGYVRMSDGVEVEVARRKRSIVKTRNAS